MMGRPMPRGSGRACRAASRSPRSCRASTVLENVATAVQAHAGSSFRFFAPVARDTGLNAQARDALSRVGLADRADTRAGSLSHGEKRALDWQSRWPRAAPAAAGRAPGRDQRAEAERLVQVMAGLKGQVTLVLIEHDMDAVFALADRVSVLCLWPDHRDRHARSGSRRSGGARRLSGGCVMLVVEGCRPVTERRRSSTTSTCRSGRGRW